MKTMRSIYASAISSVVLLCAIYFATPATAQGMWGFLKRHIAHLLGTACLMLCLSATALGQTSTITYQGRLTDAGRPLPGTYRFLEISVRHPGDPSYTTLAPRQQLTSAPYAVRATTATANVLKSGDTMSGDLNLGTHNITNAGIVTATSLSGTLDPTNISSGTANISISGSAVSFT